ncbi:MAG: bifunctional 3-demethylubiquinol 3-O-methyltransferase/2-polyprenyl-6-hydroxyphenol methylase [Candidatus Pelagibacter sp.]|nr:bifunctional 3-demethylubiquinol 3-O-methyltransferase/2-polyprenyl-6-hydroxyphenol methylase [Candidatus Pelagibacter sp.]OUV96895.1 MAG: bifunctional 3-demethylubiquinol 3-O-methyltransferase/2-polyprenyl-6-hydroxyphenol methylase [Candidatus Pelagibacter sp. TMED142]
MDNKNTVNKEEIRKFSKLADEWWNPNGKFAPLHKFNPIRQEYLIKEISNNFNIDLDTPNSFKNLKILDVGCGGGLLCEPFSRLGADVTGIDASEKNIAVAKIHSNKSNLNINYVCTRPEKISKKYDVLLCMEIVEHVDNLKLFYQSCVNLLNKNGLIFFATINQTVKSYLLAIIGAEYVLRWLPIGTHDWKKFVKPTHMIDSISNLSLNYKKITGVTYNPFYNRWNLSNDIDVNYICYFKKN